MNVSYDCPAYELNMDPKLTESYIKRPAAFTGLNEVFESNPKTVMDCLRYWSDKHPEKDAVVFRSTTEPRFAVSWLELCERACAMAKAYTDMGIKPGEVIAICTRPCPEWLYVVFGAIAAGITVITIVFTYSDGSDVIAMMEKLQTCALLVLDPGLQNSNWTIFQSLIDTLDPQGNVSSSLLQYIRKLVFVSPPPGRPKVKTVANILAETFNSELPPVNPDDVAILFQTSGSTGIPKLVAHSQTSFLVFGKSVDLSRSFTGKAEFNDRPFGWGGGFPHCLIYGKTRVTVSGMCPPPEDKLKFLIDVIQSEGCGSTFMLPPMIYSLTKYHKDLRDDWPLKIITTGGQPITSSLTECLGKICKQLCVVYGGTEFGLVAKLDVSSPDQFVDYSSGLPEQGVEIKIVDETGKIVPVGDRGEIYIRSGYIFHSYFNDQEKTLKIKSLDGWYKSDDYGRLNSDGYLFVEGRKSDLILSGGMNVTPVILEAVLKAHPGVESVVIVPVPDAEKYQVICACVIVKTGCGVTEDQLFDYMEKKHNDEEKLFTVLPKYYLLLDRFPEETSGKVSRKTLKAMAADKFSTK